MSGIQPSSLTPVELLRYGHLLNNDGLSKDWCDALLQALDDALEQLNALTKTE